MTCALPEFATVFLCPGIASVGSEEAARLGAAAAADLLEEDRTSLGHALVGFEAWRHGSDRMAAGAFFKCIMRGPRPGLESQSPPSAKPESTKDSENAQQESDETVEPECHRPPTWHLRGRHPCEPLQAGRIS